MCDSSRQWYTLLTRSKLLSPERHLRTKVPLDNFPATFPNCLPQSIPSSNTTPSSSDDSEISTSVSPMNKDGYRGVLGMHYLHQTFLASIKREWLTFDFLALLFRYPYRGVEKRKLRSQSDLIGLFDSVTRYEILMCTIYALV
ncbi:hypothetical protein J6590_084485 [Homalodisca vitripennis]|nr:hypothetical protein J6590_084485 [Homalodisca vitripennis]